MPYPAPISKQTSIGEPSANKTAAAEASGAGGSPEDASDDDEDDHTETFVLQQTGVSFALAPESSAEPDDEFGATPIPPMNKPRPVDDETNARDPREGTPAPPNAPRARGGSTPSERLGEINIHRKAPTPAPQPADDYAAPPTYGRAGSAKPHPYQERTVTGQRSTSQPSSGLHRAQLQQQIQQLPEHHHPVPVEVGMPAHARAAAASAQQQLAQPVQHAAVYAHAAPHKLHAGSPPPAVDVYGNPVPKQHWPPQPTPQPQTDPFAQVVNKARGSFGADHGLQGYVPQAYAPQQRVQLPTQQIHHHQHVLNPNINPHQYKYQQQQYWEYAPAQTQQAQAQAQAAAAHHQAAVHAQAAHQQTFAPTTEPILNPREWRADVASGGDKLYAPVQAPAQAPVQAPAQAPARAPQLGPGYYYGGQYYTHVGQYWTSPPPAQARQAVHPQQAWVLQNQPHAHQHAAHAKPQAAAVAATQAAHQAHATATVQAAHQAHVAATA